MASGLPYDSDEGRGLCGAITAIMHGAAYLTSAEQAAAVGPFDGFADNREPMLRVMEMHRDAVEEIDDACPAVSARTRPAQLWDECSQRAASTATATARSRCWPRPARSLHDGLRHDRHRARHRAGEVQAAGRRRHAQDRQPDRADGAAEARATTSRRSRRSSAYIDAHDTIEGAPDLEDEHLPVFDCAFQPRKGARSIPWRAHLRMMAAVQPFLSGAISKT